jgi:pyruvate-formate lyase-activating enzyme
MQRRGLTPTTLIELIQAAGSLAGGMTARVDLHPEDAYEAVQRWCEQTGNEMLSLGRGSVVIRRGRRLESAPSIELESLTSRVWIYTNFDCNLKCDYCCVRSAPGISRRELGLEHIERIAAEAAGLGVKQIFLTGGEPFLLPYIDQAVIACVAAAPTTLLTNGMLFKGRRRTLMEAMPRDGFAFQISLDSPAPPRHDRHRGAGSWRRAVEGIQIAQAAGFCVRVAATIGLEGDDEIEEERKMHALLDRIGIRSTDRIIRRVARRGRAETGVVLTTEGVIPEITYTDRGVFWHPVGADDPDMMIASGTVSLAAAVETVRRRLETQLEREVAAASRFPCA